jgi:ankyrin repeat protein
LKRRSPFSHRNDVKKHLDRLDTGSVADETDLYTAYDDIFRRNTIDKEVASSHARKIYKMLVCRVSSLSIDAITTAVAFNERDSTKDETVDSKYILQITQDFIVETASGTLDFAHASVKDYLQGEHHSVYSDSECHAQVAKMCIKYMSCQVWAAYKVSLRSDAFLQYSHTYWGEHCATLSREDRHNLGVSEVLSHWFIERSEPVTFQHWLQIAGKRDFIFFRGRSSDSDGPVFAACIWNLVEVLEKLLLTNPPHNFDLDSLNITGDRPLSLAAQMGHTAVVRLLLETGAKIDSLDMLCRSPLSLAAENGYEVIVKILLEHGAYTGLVAGENRSALGWAAQNGYETIVKLLLDKGAYVNLKDDTEGRTPLSYAAMDGHEAVVRLLLEKNAEIESQDVDGQTPLLWAAIRGHEDVIRLLLEHHAEIEAQGGEGRTPLSFAAGRGDEAIVKLLLDKGANVNSHDLPFKWTPLLRAATGGHETIVERLIEKGAKVDWQYSDGSTLLSWAADKGNVALVERLLKEGAQVDLEDIEGQTPLSFAASKGNETIAKLLLEKGANANSHHLRHKWTPLLRAAMGGHEAIVERLIKKGAKVDWQDSFGWTSLSWAAARGHVATVELLLKEGAKVDLKDNEGRTPLWRAINNDHEAVVKLLQV